MKRKHKPFKKDKNKKRPNNMRKDFKKRK